MLMQSDKIKIMMMIIKHQDTINQVQLWKTTMSKARISKLPEMGDH